MSELAQEAATLMRGQSTALRSLAKELELFPAIAQRCRVLARHCRRIAVRLRRQETLTPEARQQIKTAVGQSELLADVAMKVREVLAEWKREGVTPELIEARRRLVQQPPLVHQISDLR